jgi:hypothetical protein
MLQEKLPAVEKKYPAHQNIILSLFWGHVGFSSHRVRIGNPYPRTYPTQVFFAVELIAIFTWV